MSFARPSRLISDRKGAPLSLRPLPEPAATVLVVGGPISGTDPSSLCERVRVLLAESGAEVVVCDVGGLVDPDVGTVDTLARMQLTARGRRCQVRLCHASSELQELLALVGLADVVP
jgi:ABC-type transporter Mla MlaB component